MTEKTENYKKILAVLDEVYLVLDKHKVTKRDAAQLAANLFAGLVESSKSDEEEAELSALFTRVLAKRFDVEDLIANAANTRTQ